MKYCPHCGRSCSEHARFCINCGYCFDAAGAPLRADPPQATVAQPQPMAAPRPVPPPVIQPQPMAAPRPVPPPPPVRPMPPRVDPNSVETYSSDLYAQHRNDGYDPTATGTTFSGYRMNTPAQETPQEDKAPRMSMGLWNSLLFGAIGLSVIALIAAVVFYYSNPWI
ncbi:MAG: zinc ribbon domain-containing protein [Oscillospiraceae bacterium]|nr:zinc ribbon domain-containing protein [Oscillospiraceae bacterium]